MGSNNYYKDHIVPGVKSLLLGIVAVAVGLVGSTYLKLALMGGEVLTDWDFYLRLLILIAIIGYVAYDHLIYDSVTILTQKGSDQPPLGKRRTILIYIVDVLQVFVLGMMLYVLDVDLTNAPAQNIGSRLELNKILFVVLFGLLTLWCLLIFVWHMLVGTARLSDDLREISNAAKGFYIGAVLIGVVATTLVCRVVDSPPTPVEKVICALVPLVTIVIFLFCRAPKLIR